MSVEAKAQREALLIFLLCLASHRFVSSPTLIGSIQIFYRISSEKQIPWQYTKIFKAWKKDLIKRVEKARAVGSELPETFDLTLAHTTVSERCLQVAD